MDGGCDGATQVNEMIEKANKEWDELHEDDEKDDEDEDDDEEGGGEGKSKQERLLPLIRLRVRPFPPFPPLFSLSRANFRPLFEKTRSIIPMDPKEIHSLK